MNYEVSVPDLTSVILDVRSYFAKRGIVVRVVKKKAQPHFTTSTSLPILVKDSETVSRVLDKRLSLEVV